MGRGEIIQEVLTADKTAFGFAKHGSIYEYGIWIWT